MNKYKINFKLENLTSDVILRGETEEEVCEKFHKYSKSKYAGIKSVELLGPIPETPVDEYNQYPIEPIGIGPCKPKETPAQIAQRVYDLLLYEAKIFCQTSETIEDLNAIIQIASTRIDELKGNQ